jgi:hypothetical protein
MALDLYHHRGKHAIGDISMLRMAGGLDDGDVLSSRPLAVRDRAGKRRAKLMSRSRLERSD